MPNKKRRNTSQQQLRKKQRSKTKSKEESQHVKTVISFNLIATVDVTQRCEENSQGISNIGFQRLFNGNESFDSMLYRKSSFEQCWKNINDDISVGAMFVF